MYSLCTIFQPIAQSSVEGDANCEFLCITLERMSHIISIAGVVDVVTCIYQIRLVATSSLNLEHLRQCFDGCNELVSNL